MNKHVSFQFRNYQDTKEFATTVTATGLGKFTYEDVEESPYHLWYKVEDANLAYLIQLAKEHHVVSVLIWC